LKRHELATNNEMPVSHPVRVRGLKHPEVIGNIDCTSVAPRAGAWIETETRKERFEFVRSHPVRVRGLKRCVWRLC